jgi:hypothetical protein
LPDTISAQDPTGQGDSAIFLSVPGAPALL